MLSARDVHPKKRYPLPLADNPTQRTDANGASMQTPNVKRCSRGEQCLNLHPDKPMLPRTPEYFFRNKSKYDGLTDACKVCSYDKQQKWRKDNPEKKLEADRRWRETHRESRRETTRRWLLKNPDKHHRWRKNNPDKNRENNQRWCTRHPESQRLATKRYRQKYPDKLHAKDRLNQQKRRARVRALPATLTQAEWEQILADYGYACAYCGKSWLDCKLQQEHVIPVTQGGGYTKENIVPACDKCNCKKNGRTPEQASMKLRNR